MTDWLHGAPLAALTAWLPPNDAAERPQVQLATVDEDGDPDVRTVLLSEWSTAGLLFHTDAASRKARQLDARPVAAMLLLWPGFTRQLVVRGPVVPASEAELERGYAGRSAYLRQLAWLNTDATAELERVDRIAAWRAFAARQDLAQLRPPHSWTGYVVRPTRLTFWESDPDGPSHRLEHRRGGDGSWTVHHLAG